jgi:ssDNA-binding Zn-finger/Zn-ribbon topoisomerase 1
MPVADSAPQTWIVRTGQRRKAMVTLAIACLAPVGSVLAFSFGEGAVAIALLVVAALSFVTFASAVRCPKCRKSISFMVLISRPSSKWLHDLFGLEMCPACHDEGTPAR